MTFIVEVREWLMLFFEGYICWILTMEYFYDANKDALKKQRKTKTTKKTTQPDGTVTEENSEILESTGEKNDRPNG